VTASDPVRLAVLLSGEGTSLENLFECIEAGSLAATIEVVIASKQSAGGLERARRRGIPAVAVPRKHHPDPGDFNDALHAELERFEIDLVACLGFLSPFETRGKFDGRAINVHPALIPAFCGRGFYGRRVYEAVLEAGVKLTGATVHFVDSEYDCGPIIAQEAVAVVDGDTVESLAERVQAVERQLVPKVIALFGRGQLAIEARCVRIVDPDQP
jgi:phosphoribosylglycinamide formyltransferase-1